MTNYAFLVAEYCGAACSVGVVTIQRLLLQPYLLGPHDANNNTAAPKAKKYFLFINQLFPLFMQR
ncbi:hypothetical protein LRS05_00970 [Flavobacterium sp. J372]|uniref:hypothetical protein n=1 Tax=Flavobacterium sp. J372 TaxID=2898436 RepID=UPI002151AC87|nr:hypothetical protein [Flavobacterium sp. J372]MCR5860807.1 hypothetical protein [Flavobacterium sp. J372]